MVVFRFELAWKLKLRELYPAVASMYGSMSPNAVWPYQLELLQRDWEKKDVLSM